MSNRRKEKFTKWVTRPSSVARNIAFMDYFIMNGGKRFIVFPIDKNRATYYLEEVSYKNFLKKLLKKELKNWKNHIKNYFKDIKKLINIAKVDKDKLKKLSNKELWDYYQNYHKAMVDFGSYVYMPFALEEFLELKIYKIFPEKFDLITSPNKLNEFQTMLLMLFKGKPEEVARDYGRFNVYSLNEEPYSAEYFRKLKKTLKEKELKTIKNQLRKNHLEFGKFIKSVKDENLKAKCILMHEYAFIRTDRVDAFKHALFCAISFFDRLVEIINKPDWARREAINLLPEEIKQILFYKNTPALNDIKKRSYGKCIFDYHKGKKMIFITDKKEIEKIKKMVEGDYKKSNIIKGVIANGGKTTGKVVVVLNKEELKKVQKGEVLVAASTEPIYTPFMKNSIAIITDEGGITSHAAIISRELGIPCIIGTKIATKVLKDGDLVEVDANKGIVKILK